MRAFRLSAILLFGAAAGCSSRAHTSAPAPAIDSITPNQGPRVGGNTVHIAGHHFGAKPFVTFGAANVTAFASVGDQGIDLVVPPNLVGPANVTVVNDAGLAATALDAYYFMPLPARAYDGRFFADAVDLAHANRVVVQTTADVIGGLVVELPPAATGSIAGTFTDASGAPLEGHAAVAIRLDAPQAAIAFPSGVDGRYRIDGLPPGTYRVTTAEGASDFVDQAYAGVFAENGATPVPVAAGSVRAGIDFALAPGARIGGSVTSTAGAGLDGVSVFAIDSSGRSLQFASGVTDTAGRYEVRGLAPGAYHLLAFSVPAGAPNTWFPDAYDAGSAQPVAVSGTALAVASFSLPPAAAIAGSVFETPSAAGLPGVTVIAHDVDRGLDYASGTGGDGSYLLPGLPAGHYRLQAPELGLYYAGVTTTAGATVLTLSSAQQLAGRNFLGRLAPAPPCGNPAGTGTLAGRVAGPGAAPMLRAAVVASGGMIATATSGQDGRWSIPCLAPGSYVVRVTVPGSALTRATAGPFLVAPASTRTVDVTLAPGPRLAGIVRDAQTHAGLSGARVRVREESTGESTATVTASDGSWRVDRFPSGGLHLGSYIVEVSPTVEVEYFSY